MITLNKVSVILTKHQITSYTSLRGSLLSLIYVLPRSTVVKLIIYSRSRIVRKHAVRVLSQSKSYVMLDRDLTPYVIYILTLTILP